MYIEAADVTVFFHHYPEVVADEEVTEIRGSTTLSYTRTRRSRATMCHVFKGKQAYKNAFGDSGKVLDHTYLLGAGESVCNCTMDHFNRVTGRKISLQRALEACGFKRPTRAIIWGTYFKETNSKFVSTV